MLPQKRDTSTRYPRRTYVLLCLAACLLTLLFLALNWTELIDDAYIFFRYAANINSGHGYVFNPGQWVEGATSVSWTLLLALFDRLGLSLFLSVKLLGALCIVGILVLLSFEFFRQGVHPAIMVLAMTLLIVDRNFVLSIMMGLETGLYALLLLALYSVAQWYAQGGGRAASVALALVGLLLFLTRPEALLLLALVALIIVVLHLREPQRYSLLPLLIGGIGLLLITGWRFALFGDVIPNSVRSKSVLGFALEAPRLLLARAAAGMAYLRSFLLDSLLLALLAGVGLLAHRRRFEVAVAMVALAAGGAVVLLNSGDWMPFARLLTPTLPLLALFAGLGLQWIAGRSTARAERALYGGLAVAALLLVASAFWMIHDRTPFVADRWPESVCYRQAGLALREQLTADDLIAAEALGEIGYVLMDTPFLDMFGLTEPFIARHGTIPLETFTLGKHHYDYVMAQRPTLFLFHSPPNNHLPYLVERGYDEAYDTLRITGPEVPCALIAGLSKEAGPRLRPALDARFLVEEIDARAIPTSEAATWPLGLR